MEGTHYIRTIFFKTFITSSVSERNGGDTQSHCASPQLPFIVSAEHTALWFATFRKGNSRKQEIVSICPCLLRPSFFLSPTVLWFLLLSHFVLSSFLFFYHLLSSFSPSSSTSFSVCACCSSVYCWRFYGKNKAKEAMIVLDSKVYVPCNYYLFSILALKILLFLFFFFFDL